MSGRFSVETVFKAVDRLTRPVRRMQAQVGQFVDKARHGLKSVDKVTSSMVSGIQRYGRAAVAALGILAAATTNALGIGMDFEQTLVNAAVKFPGEIRKGTAAFSELEKAARDVGAATEFTSSQAASGLNFLAMAGFNAQQSIGALPGLVNLATAAETDLATASDIATDSLGALNLLTKDAAQLQKNLTRVSDVMALTTTRANTNITDMFEAMRDGAPTAVAAGASVETVSTMIGVMANAGIKGTKAGTALKNIFLGIGAPGSAAAKILRRIGVETTDSSGNMRDALDVFEDFLAATSKLSESQRLAAFKEIFGKIPIAAAINLTNAAGSMKEFRAELEAAGGVTKRMADTMRDTSLGRWKTLLSVIESIKLQVFDVNAGPLANALDRIIEKLRTEGPALANKFGEGLMFVLDNFEGIVAKGLQFAKIIGIFIAFTAVLKTVAVALAVVNLVAMANPLVLLALAVAGLVAAFSALVVWIDDVVAAFEKLPNVVKMALTPIRAALHAMQFIKGLVTDNESDSTQGGVNVTGSDTRSIETLKESRSTSALEMTIKDETGRAEMTKGKPPEGFNLQFSGIF